MITPRQAEAVELLATGATQKATAEALGLGLRTVNRWAGSEGFKDALKSRSLEVRSELRAQLLGMATEALQGLKDAMSGKNTKIASIRAAELVLKACGVLDGKASEPEEEPKVIDVELGLPIPAASLETGQPKKATD